MDQELHNLIGDWLNFVRQNNIKQPQDRDVRRFLTSKGFNPKVVDNLISTIASNKPAVPAQDNADEEKKQVLQKIEDTIRAHFTPEQIKLLKNELEHE